MTLDTTVQFIDERVPGFRQRIRGASAATLAELQGFTSRPLPRAYARFLALMGEDSAEFDLFPGFRYGASQLVASRRRVESTAYPSDRYFKIAMQAPGPAEFFTDVFLDLQRGDGEDAPLVSFEDQSGGVMGHSYQPSDMRLGFVHHVRRSAFIDYELRALPEKVHLGFYSERSDAGTDRTWESLLGILGRLELDQPLGTGAMWWCGCSARLSLMAEGSADAGVTVAMAHVDRDSLRRMTELLSDHLPRMTKSEGECH
jgi:hypothetical protein